MKKKLVTIVLSVTMVAAGMGTAPVQAKSAKAPVLCVKTATVKVDKAKTIRIKNIKKAQVKSLTVKSTDRKIATVKKKTAVSFSVTGKNAYEQTKATVTLKLKKKIKGKKSYRFTLKIAVNPDKNLATKDQRAPEYAQKSDWLHLPVTDKKKVDTFFIYSSDVMMDGTELASMDDELHRDGAQEDYYEDATNFEYDTNVYAPLYRQTDEDVYKKKTVAKLEKYQRHEQKKDIFDALDYYFKNYNGGKPFILAGDEQGATMVDIVVADYMKRHPDYKKRLVAVYKTKVDKDKVDADVNAYGKSHNMDMTAQKNIEILYTNDVHCWVSENIGYAGLARIRDELKNGGDDTILVDNGDAVQGGPIGLLTKGEAIIDLMNDVGYDVATFGNHEFDYQMDQFFKLYERAKSFKYICCNFKDLITGKLIAEPSQIKEVNGKKIAFIGVDTPSTLRTSTPRFFQDEKGNLIYGFSGDTKEEFYETVQAQIDNVKKQGADYVILMGHLGIDDEVIPFRSTDLIANTSGLDVVLDGHSHTVMPNKTVTDKDGRSVLLSQTGTALKYVGRLTITGDGKLRTELISDYQIKEPRIEQAIIREEEEFQPKLEEKVGTVGFDMVARAEDSSWIVRSKETNLSDFCADAYREVFGTDIGAVNSGGVRANIPAGDITYGTLLSVHPYTNDMVIRKVTGQELLDAMEFSVECLPEKSGGLLHFSGVTYDVDLKKKADIKKDKAGNFVSITGSERRVSNVMVNGEPIDPAKTYTVASTSYIFRDAGVGYSKSMFSGELFEQPKTDLDILIEYINMLGGVIPEKYREPQSRMKFIS